MLRTASAATAHRINPSQRISTLSRPLWADDLAAVIKARNLQRPVLVGWSYGGYTIADYVRKFGDAGLGGLVFLAAVTKNGT